MRRHLLSICSASSHGIMFDSSAFKARYDVHEIDVRPSAQISGRTTAVLAKLKATAEPESKISIVALRAQAKSANKLISIVEISKRQFRANGAQVYQYAALSSEPTDIKRISKPALNPEEHEKDMIEDSQAFASLSTDSAMKKRTVPVVTIYLSTQSIKELRLAYG